LRCELLGPVRLPQPVHGQIGAAAVGAANV